MQKPKKSKKPVFELELTKGRILVNKFKDITEFIEENKNELPKIASMQLRNLRRITSIIESRC